MRLFNSICILQSLRIKLTTYSFPDDIGSGDGEVGSNGSNSLNLYRECSDRVLMPCDSEEFITVRECKFEDLISHLWNKI